MLRSLFCILYYLRIIYYDVMKIIEIWLIDMMMIIYLFFNYINEGIWNLYYEFLICIDLKSLNNSLNKDRYSFNEN